MSTAGGTRARRAARVGGDAQEEKKLTLPDKGLAQGDSGPIFRAFCFAFLGQNQAACHGSLFRPPLLS
jgi:hypothetical protein